MKRCLSSPRANIPNDYTSKYHDPAVKLTSILASSSPSKHGNITYIHNLDPADHKEGLNLTILRCQSSDKKEINDVFSENFCRSFYHSIRCYVNLNFSLHRYVQIFKTY